MTDTPTREVLWNISSHWIVYPCFLLALGLAVWFFVCRSNFTDNYPKKKDHSRFLHYGLNVMPTALLLPCFCVCSHWIVLCVLLPSNPGNTSQHLFSECIPFHRHCIFCF